MLVKEILVKCWRTVNLTRINVVGLLIRCIAVPILWYIRLFGSPEKKYIAEMMRIMPRRSVLGGYIQLWTESNEAYYKARRVNDEN